LKIFFFTVYDEPHFEKSICSMNTFLTQSYCVTLEDVESCDIHSPFESF